MNNKYKISSTLWMLPKHQRKKFSGRKTGEKILGHSPVQERSFYLTYAEISTAWDQLKELTNRGEIEIRNPDGTVFRFDPPETAAPEPEKIEKLPVGSSVLFYSDIDVEDLDGIVPIGSAYVDDEDKKKKGRKGKRQ